LVERDADSVDRRRVAVRITDEGLQLLERIGDLESVMAPLFASCTEKQMKALNDGLDSLRG
jgi:DNA-binding MarR family transcriptional regulator